MEDLDLILKWVAGVGTVLTVLTKAIDSFSKEKRKKSLIEEIKLICEILASEKDIPVYINKDLLSEKLNTYLNLSTNDRPLFNVLYALFIFFGFGYWSIRKAGFTFV